MALQEISSNITYKKWKDCKVDTEFKGWIATKKFSQEYNSYTLIVKTEDGTKVGLPLSGQLKYQLEDYGTGTYILIRYKGMEKVKGMMVHQFETFTDPDLFKKDTLVPTKGPIASEENQKFEEEPEEWEDEDFDEDDLPF